MKMLADDGTKRTVPKSTTLVALAEALGVDVRDLMEDDPRVALQAVLEAFDRAPIRKAAKVQVFGRRVQNAGEDSVVPIGKGRKARR